MLSSYQEVEVALGKVHGDTIAALVHRSLWHEQ